MQSLWGDADTSAKDERISGVAFIEKNSTVDGGNADFVAVILHACNDSAHDAFGMKHAFG